jgi:hypothetical protein
VNAKRKAKRKANRKNRKSTKANRAAKRQAKRQRQRRRRKPQGPRRPRACYHQQLRQAIKRFLPRKGLALQSRDGRVGWTPRLLVICMLLLVWSKGQSLGERFADARLATVAMYKSRRRPGKSYEGFIAALCKQSQKLLAVLCRGLREAVKELAVEGGCWRIDGWLVYGADGSKVECPMTAANEQAFGCAGKTKSPPQQFLTVLLHVGTGLPWDWRRGLACSSERGQLLEMIFSGVLPEPAKEPRCLLLADAGFTGYDLLKSIMDGGRQFLIRVGANVRLLKKLGYAVREHPGIVYLWPADKQKRRKAKDGRGPQGPQEPLILRLITLHDGQKAVHLLSSVLEASDLSDAAAGAMYRRRWGIEVFYRSLKRTLSGRKMLSDCPAHARVELDWCVAGLWMLGLMSVQRLLASGQPPGRWSVAKSLAAVRQAMRRIDKSCRRGVLAEALAQAVKDSYVRRRSKTARHWPHKKKDKPPGVPKYRIAEASEVRLAQELRRIRMAA